MFRDNSLMPKEAIRLSALGLLSQGPMSYAAVANEVRHFTTRFWGPTLDVMASSIELMRLEGLVEADGEAATAGEAVLHLTEAGRTELQELLSAAVRVPASDFNKLVVALKLRFMHLLPMAQQRDQAEGLIEMRQGERARLIDLRATHANDEGYLPRWLDREISHIEDDLVWLEELSAGLEDS
jgi:DNA-binding PadR family transcriptional regulator